ncbi:MAG: PAS domain S-box protein [Aureliella sp.]
MALNAQRRIVGTLYARAPYMFWALVLFLLLGFFLALRELQVMAVVRDALACGAVTDEAASRVALATMATNVGVVLLMMLLPGLMLIAAGCRLIGDCHDNQARLQAAFKYSLHPMIVTDPRGKIESASHSVKAVFGWSPEELVGQNVTVLMPASFRRYHDDKVAAHLATGRETLIGKPRELEATRRDGTTFPCYVTLWKAPLPAQGSYLLIAIISDISEQKANEARIAELNQQVLVAARQAGKAEIATNVLHNVGNVLSSVNVSAALLREGLQDACYQDVKRVSDLIESHASDLAGFIAQDSRGRHLSRFLLELFSQLRVQRDTLDQELRSLEKSIDHIRAIVQSQQQFAKGISRVIEVTDVSEVVADAVRICEASLAHHGIAVEVFSSPMPKVLLDKQKFLHIMVNLIGNARHACLESVSADKRVKIWVERNADQVSVKLQDNGVGIEPAIIKQIFNHGFTTRKDGHGFGLHSVALAIEESCGRIEVHSDGAGQGATFCITIPVVMPTPETSGESHKPLSLLPTVHTPE